MPSSRAVHNVTSSKRRAHPRRRASARTTTPEMPRQGHARPRKYWAIGMAVRPATTRPPRSTATRWPASPPDCSIQFAADATGMPYTLIRSSQNSASSAGLSGGRTSQFTAANWPVFDVSALATLAWYASRSPKRWCTTRNRTCCHVLRMAYGPRARRPALPSAVAIGRSGPSRQCDDGHGPRRQRCRHVTARARH